MKCEHIRDQIDELIFKKDSQSQEEFLKHLNTCPDCKVYFEGSLKAQNVISLLKSHEPVLNNPEKLWGDILNSVNETLIDKTVSIEEPSRKNNSMLMIRRILAAASVCLILVFGIEQYIGYSKIKKLESYASQISKNINNPIGFKTSLSFNSIVNSKNSLPKSLMNMFKNKENNLRSKLIMARLSAMNFDAKEIQYLRKYKEVQTGISIEDYSDIKRKILSH